MSAPATRRRGVLGRVPACALAAGLAFLYAPIAFLVLFSFDRSSLVSVWSGWSVRWYAALFRDAAVGHAFRLSLAVALLSATLSLLIAVPASLLLERGGRFRGRFLFASLVSAPLVMPDVLIGLSLLLLFTTAETLFGVPGGQGVLTIVIGHTTLGVAFATVVVQGRLAILPSELEDAAADLGASPTAAFRHVTLPLLVPGLLAAWLLAFSLSLDDVVIASFLGGPGSTTLPVLLLSRVHLGLSPELNALATLLVGAVGLLVAAATIALGRRSG